MSLQRRDRIDARAGALDRPRSTQREDLVTVLLATWLIGGIGLDGWAHSNLERQLESFFTPWHAVLYSGFVATALWVLWLVQTRRAEHRTWTQAVPRGYGLGLVGVAVFAVGGVGDLLWHQVFGIETGIAALLSPTHLLLFTGVALLLLAPFRAAWSSPEPPSAALLGVVPAFLSITLLTALVAFFFQYSSLFAIELAFSSSAPVRFSQGQPPQLVGVLDAWANDIQIKQIMAALVTSLILVAPVLLMLRRWRLPLGAATILFLVVATIIVALDGFRAWEQLVGAAAAGVAADVAIARLRPSAARVGAFRAVGSLMPWRSSGAHSWPRCGASGSAGPPSCGRARSSSAAWPATPWSSSCSRRRSRARAMIAIRAGVDAPAREGTPMLTVAIVRHRAKGPGSKAAGIGMAFKLIEAALVRAGARFEPARQHRRMMAGSDVGHVLEGSESRVNP
jgi:hypothetical protein